MEPIPVSAAACLFVIVAFNDKGHALLKQFGERRNFPVIATRPTVELTRVEVYGESGVWKPLEESAVELIRAARGRVRTVTVQRPHGEYVGEFLVDVNDCFMKCKSAPKSSIIPLRFIYAGDPWPHEQGTAEESWLKKVTNMKGEVIQSCAVAAHCCLSDAIERFTVDISLDAQSADERGYHFFTGPLEFPGAPERDVTDATLPPSPTSGVPVGDIPASRVTKDI
jgi:hypothetical protein